MSASAYHVTYVPGGAWVPYYESLPTFSSSVSELILCVARVSLSSVMACTVNLHCPAMASWIRLTCQ